jgi:hypothetical protein
MRRSKAFRIPRAAKRDLRRPKQSKEQGTAGLLTSIRFSFVASAPPILCELAMKDRTRNREMLIRLLTDDSMRRPWREVARRIRSSRLKHASDPFLGLWERICLSAAAASAKTKLTQFARIARLARQLAKAVEGRDRDIYAQEVFPALDLFAIVAITNDRSTFSDELRMLANRMDEKARAEAYPVDRLRGHSRARYFVRALSDYLFTMYGARLHGSVAAITRLCVGPDEIDKTYVQSVLRNLGRRKRNS